MPQVFPGECRLKGGTMSHNSPCWEHLAPYPTGSTAQGPRREPKGLPVPASLTHREARDLWAPWRVGTSFIPVHCLLWTL